MVNEDEREEPKDRESSIKKSHEERDRSPRKRSPSRDAARGRSREYSRSRSRSPAKSPSWRRRSYSGSRSRSPPRRRRSYSRSRSRSWTPPRRFNQRQRQYPADVPACRVLGVFGLSMYTSQRAIEDLMAKYGNVEKVDLILDRLTGRSKGFAFVYFDTVESATMAKDSTNGLRLDERTIRVDFSKTKRAHTPTPGVYMGPRLPPSRYKSSRGYSPYGRNSRSRSRSPPRPSRRSPYRSPSPRY